MVITSIIFLISLLSEIHFCRVKKEWCERALMSEGKPSFWQENRDTFGMSNYGQGVLEATFTANGPAVSNQFCGLVS